jgi:hypothetical protein
VATPATAGAVNTGSGGGGAGGNGASGGGQGGSGFVVIRYADTFALAASTTGSPSVNGTIYTNLLVAEALLFNGTLRRNKKLYSRPSNRRPR